MAAAESFVMEAAGESDGAGPADESHLSLLDASTFGGGRGTPSGEEDSRYGEAADEDGRDGAGAGAGPQGVLATEDEQYVVVDLCDFFPAGGSGTSSSAAANEDALEVRKKDCKHPHFLILCVHSFRSPTLYIPPPPFCARHSM